MFHPLGIDSVSLLVRDLETVSAFYREAIGLQSNPAPAGEARLGVDGRTLLRLLHRPALQPRDPEAAGLFHTAFLLPSMSDLGRWLRHIDASGVTLDGMADHLVSVALYLHDPEGNGIEIYADRPRDAWTWEGGQVRMANDRPDLQAIAALDPRPWTGAPSGTTVGHVHLQVGDIATAEPFYTGTLGLDVTRRWPQSLFMSTDGYHHHLAVNTWRSAGAGPRDPGRAGLSAVTFRVAASPPAPLTDPWGTTITFTDGTHP